jgi:glutamyl-tRNA synthetase
MTATVRTRFAPSPTGFLHIGGVRTALFNWLYARRHGGTYVLRIDDTDQQRNVEAALAPILHGFEWLGLPWDEGPHFQSQRGPHYAAAVQQLLRDGHAYTDYATAEELDAERKAAERDKRPFQYSRTWMATTADQRARFEAEGRKGVVRLRMPREGSLVLEDLVRGRVEFAWTEEADHVIQRADGSFIYHLANVVDDQSFGITHVIRAEEHLSNTPRQVFIARGLGYPLPAYAHLPYVAEPGSKRKLSKRKLDAYLKNPDFAKVHKLGTEIADAMGLRPSAETFNPVVVDFYEQVGFLPDAIINYLVLLGWSLDDKTELLTRAQMIDGFSLDRVNVAPASFDPTKLVAFQAQYMRALPVTAKVDGVLAIFDRARRPRPARERVTRIVEALGDRLTLFGEMLLPKLSFFFDDDDAFKPFDEAEYDKRLRAPDAARRLEEFRGWLAAREDFAAPALEAGTQEFLAARGLKLSDIVHPVRMAVTGISVGPGLFDCLSIIGKDSSLRRIDRALARARGPT